MDRDRPGHCRYLDSLSWRPAEFYIGWSRYLDTFDADFFQQSFDSSTQKFLSQPYYVHQTRIVSRKFIAEEFASPACHRSQTEPVPHR